MENVNAAINSRHVPRQNSSFKVGTEFTESPDLAWRTSSEEYPSDVDDLAADDAEMDFDDVEIRQDNVL